MNASNQGYYIQSQWEKPAPEPQPQAETPIPAEALPDPADLRRRRLEREIHGLQTALTAMKRNKKYSKIQIMEIEQLLSAKIKTMENMT